MVGCIFHICSVWAKVPPWPSSAKLEGIHSHTLEASLVHFQVKRGGSVAACFTSFWVTDLRIFRDIKHLPNLGRFLMLYFVYSDGYSAIGTLGVLFALNEVAVPQALLVLLLVETQLCALTGCILFAKLQRWLQTSKGIPVHRSAIYIIAINLFIMGLLPIYGLLGAIPSMPFGLKTAGEVFIFGGIYGLQIGAVQTYSRSVFSSMVCPLLFCSKQHSPANACPKFSKSHNQRISDAFQVPKGFECTFFGAYEVTDKGSSWVAPLIAALIMSNSKTICGVQKDGHIFQLNSVIAS